MELEDKVAALEEKVANLGRDAGEMLSELASLPQNATAEQRAVVRQHANAFYDRMQEAFPAK